jgi:two-component system, NarL family, sensor kinase
MAGRLVTVQVGKFAVAGVVALAVVGLGTSIASRRVGEREAVSDARTTTLAKAQGLVEPALEDGILTGSPAARARLDAVKGDVLDVALIRMKVWNAAGTIVYSDEARLIGTTYQLGADEQSSITAGRIEAEVSDLSKPENRFERSYGKLLEVYLPIRTPSGTPLLFEAYYRYSLVSDNGSRLWRSFAPIALGALVLLQLVQIPLAWSLARHLRQRLQEREVLLERALQASEVERRQIASDLHDGVVQDLAGVAYSLSAVTRSGNGAGPDPALVDQSAEAVRATIRALRSLVVDIYPPDFGEEPLDAALGDLVERARARGLQAELDVTAAGDPIPDHAARLVYRVAQEGIRNAVNHSGARHVRVQLGTSAGRVTVEVVDDGRGFDEAEARERSAAGHVGLRALSGLLGDNGGTLDIHSVPGEGTTLRAEVPW